MDNERPFENIIPVPNIKVGYFEKEEYLKIIDRQEKQIQSNAWTILALQSRIEILEKRLQTTTNADLFKQTFGIYATEVWSMNEADFLEWLNSEVTE